MSIFPIFLIDRVVPHADPSIDHWAGKEKIGQVGMNSVRPGWIPGKFFWIVTTLMLVMIMSGCAYLNLRHTNSIEACANTIAASLARDLDKAHGNKSIVVSVPVDAVTYSQSNFGLAFQEFLTSAVANYNPHVVDIHFMNKPIMPGKVDSVPLSRDKPGFTISDAGVVLVSTYLVSNEEVVITTRALDVSTNMIVASTYAILSRSQQVDDLLGRSKGVIVYEK